MLCLVISTAEIPPSMSSSEEPGCAVARVPSCRCGHWPEVTHLRQEARWLAPWDDSLGVLTLSSHCSSLSLPWEMGAGVRQKEVNIAPYFLLYYNLLILLCNIIVSFQLWENLNFLCPAEKASQHFTPKSDGTCRTIVGLPTPNQSPARRTQPSQPC